ncbi:MAG: hypothetical protein ACQEXJ_01800 [Myxococcota bacterium]
MRKASTACFALALVLSLTACGGGGNGGTSLIPDGDEDVTEDTGEVSPDVGPQCTEATAAEDCEGVLDLDACEEAACEGGECVAQAIPDCCEAPADCESPGACETVDCVADQCVYEPVPDCCEAPADCEPPGACETVDCVADQCVYEPIADCCETAADCEGQVDAGACDVVECTEDNTCEVRDDVVEGCCESNNDCAGLGDGCCNVASCSGDNVCVVEELDDCCAASADCDDGSPATTDICETTCVAEGCVYEAPVCEVNQVFTSKNFDDGTFQLLKTADDDEGDAVGIQVVDDTAVSQDHSLYFGDPECMTYYDADLSPSCTPIDAFGAADGVQLAVETSEIELNEDTGAYLGFWVKMAAEPAAEIPGGTFVSTDFLAVDVDDGSTVQEVWKSTDEQALGLENTTNGEWVHQAADLTQYAGESITIRFRFVSDGDADFNSDTEGEPWYGAYVDSLQVKASCQNAECTAEDPACPDDNDGCTTNACTLFAKGTKGVCAYETNAPGGTCTSCNVPADCGSDACLDYICTAEGTCSSTLKDECCQPSSDFPEATEPPDVAVEGFEDGDISDWEIEDPFDDNVTWQLLQALAYAGEYTLYFGDPASLSYDADDGNAAVATAWTPAMELDDDPFRIPVLQFWLFLSTEFDGAAEPPEADFDQLTVLVDTMTDAEPVVVWESNDAIQGSTRNEWAQIGVDLDAWAGSTVRVGFRFDSVDDASNTHGGVRIDELTVTSICTGEGTCLGQADCDDGDACTTDWCVLGECQSEKTDPLCCDADEDCDDGNNCTIDTCSEEGSCTFAYDETKTNCCSEAPWVDAWTATFEDGDDGFTVDTDSTPVTWHRTTDAAASGEASFNFSDPATGMYATGDDTASSGRLISKPITVPPFEVGTPYAEFELLMATEWDDNDPTEFQPIFSVDDFRVLVAPADDLEAAEEWWVSHYLTNTTRGQWLHSRVDLSDWRGEDVRLVFEFDSGDEKNNGYAGPFVDDVGFATTCKAAAGVECVYGGDCEASDACKEPRCTSDFQCTEVPKDVPQCCEPFPVPELSLTFEGEPGEAWNLTSCEAESPTAETDPDSVWQFADAQDAAGISPQQGSQVLYFGNGTDYGGSAGMAACGIAETPTVTLGDSTPWDLEFQLYLDVEKSNDCDNGSPDFGDVFTIEVVDAETEVATEIFDKVSNVGCNEYDTWTSHTADLDAFAGKTVYFRFSFSTFDAIENTGKGIALDDWQLIQGCAAQ